MPAIRQCARMDTLALKSQITQKLGKHKAGKYFKNLKSYLDLKLSKMEFEKLCYSTIGRENVLLHNHLIKSILMNAQIAHASANKQEPRQQFQEIKSSTRNAVDSLGPFATTRKPRTNRDRRCGDPSRKASTTVNIQEVIKVPEKQAGPEVTSIDCETPSLNVQEVCGSQEKQITSEVIAVTTETTPEVVMAEHEEMVEEARACPTVQSRSPVRPPVGIWTGVGGLPHSARDSSEFSSVVAKTCQSNLELPDTMTLMERMNRRLEHTGMSLSKDGANVLNYALDAYLKRLIKPCLELASSRGHRTASLEDFHVAMQLKPMLLGVNWPVMLEKITLCSMEE